MQQDAPTNPGIPNAPSGQGAASADGRRRSGRLEQEMLYCEYGKVLDLSAGGMRIVCRRVPPAGQLVIALHGIDETFKVKARVAWKKRIGLLKHEVGFQFLDVSPQLSRKLTNLATTCRMRRAM
jgi:hypothetical protein